MNYLLPRTGHLLAGDKNNKVFTCTREEEEKKEVQITNGTSINSH